MSDTYAIGVDIGGTKVAAGVVDDSGAIVARARADTPHRSTSPHVVEDTIVGVVQQLREQHRAIVAVGIGAAGWVSSDRATVVFAPHLSWRNEPLREGLRNRIDVPVFVDNDANAALWAEYRFGTASGESHVIMITLGTGIGGALLIDGRIERGKYGLAGEFGHMQIVPDGHRCECGNRGCWEQYASGRALIREARQMIDAQSPVAHDLAERVAREPGGLTGPLITEAAHAGDGTATDLIAEIGNWLGIGLANLAAAYDPGMFVIGGGVSAAGDTLMAPARARFARALTGRGYREPARIELARLGNDAGLIGAADLARIAVREAGAGGDTP